MNNIVEIINNLPDLLPLNPAENRQIQDAEIQLRVSFSEEYKTYLAQFGAIMADGIELTGIAKSEHRDVVALTKKERALNPKVPNNMYVIENTCVDGIIVWQDSKGNVYQTYPESEPKMIASSMAEYILKRQQK